MPIALFSAVMHHYQVAPS